jgi:hypothetical protein
MGDSKNAWLSAERVRMVMESRERETHPLLAPSPLAMLRESLQAAHNAAMGWVEQWEMKINVQAG